MNHLDHCIRFWDDLQRTVVEHMDAYIWLDGPSEDQDVGQHVALLKFWSGCYGRFQWHIKASGEWWLTFQFLTNAMTKIYSTKISGIDYDFSGLVPFILSQKKAMRNSKS